MPLTVRDLVSTPDLGLRLLTDGLDVDRPITWVHVSELIDPTPFLSGGELLLTTGITLGGRVADGGGAELDDYVRRLVAAAVVGLGFGTGLSHVQVSAELIEAALRQGLPLIDVPRRTPFIAIGRAVSGALAADEYAAVARTFTAQQALTRADSRTGRAYDTSAHFLWVGERTRALDGAHIEFARSISNPVGIKVGPAATPADLLALIGALNPGGQPGRLTLITRMGAGRIRDVLPGLVRAVAAAGTPVAWVCDPMHGNTFEAPSGHKTRNFDDVLAELLGFFDVHRAEGTHPGGIHIEFTGDNVTECVGGSHEIVAGDLHQRYETACDPRLNRSQALDLAFTVAESYRRP